MFAQGQEVLSPILLRSATPGAYILPSILPNKPHPTRLAQLPPKKVNHHHKPSLCDLTSVLVLTYLESMERDSVIDSPPHSIVGLEDVPDKAPRTPVISSPVQRSKVSDANDVARQIEDDGLDAASNVQDGVRSEVGDATPNVVCHISVIHSSSSV